VELEIFTNSPLAYIGFVESFGTKYTYASVSAGWARDTRDSLISTTAGSYLRASSELAGGDLSYFRLGYQQQWYYPLSRSLTLHLGGEIGYAGGYGGKPLPFFKNFFAGGPGTVRGYRSFSLGPLDELGNSTGGNRKLTGTAEVLFPMPGAEQDRSLRLAAFIDGGQVYADKIELGELRYAAGLALFWSSPLGPLRLSFARPLNDQPGDRSQTLQFTFGTGF
jgi:outer membrane protein insertion porin family